MLAKERQQVLGPERKLQNGSSSFGPSSTKSTSALSSSPVRSGRRLIGVRLVGMAYVPPGRPMPFTGSTSR